MSMPIYVDGYSGYKANKRPRQFELDDELYEIAAVEDQWYSPEAMFFKVRTADGKRYILRYDENADTCSLQSGFDGDELLARPGIEVITVDADTIRKAEARVESCEQCHPDDPLHPALLLRSASIIGKKTRRLLRIVPVPVPSLLLSPFSILP